MVHVGNRCLSWPARKRLRSIPLITAQSHQVGLGLQQELENGLVTSIRHQMAGQKLCIDSLLLGNYLEVGWSQ